MDRKKALKVFGVVLGAAGFVINLLADQVQDKILEDDINEKIDKGISEALAKRGREES